MSEGRPTVAARFRLWAAAGWGPWARRTWAAVGVLLLASLLGPLALRGVSPSLACRAAWNRAPPRAVRLPPTRSGRRAYPVTGSSDGTAWISSTQRLISREALGGEDPWGRGWLYRVQPSEEMPSFWTLLEAQPAWEKLRGGRCLTPYSRGPDGVDDGGEGDDVRMPALLGSVSPLVVTLAHLRLGALCLAGLLAWTLIASRLVGPSRPSLLQEVLAAGFLSLLPAAAILWVCVLNAADIERSPLVRLLPPASMLGPVPMLAGTLTFCCFLLALAFRLRAPPTSRS